jgi:predicted transcriptional regulator
MKVNDLFFELSHEVRYNIFRETCDQNYRHSDLEKEMDVPGPEITRHVKRLLKNKLIKKNQDKSYYRTHFGYLIDNALDYFEVNIRFRDFINSHEITAIPKHLLLDMGILKNCKIKTQTMENIELWSQIIRDAEEYIWSITEQALDTDLPVIQEKINNKKISIRSIMHDNLIKKYVQTEDWENYIEGPKPEVFKNLSNKIGIPESIRKLNNLKLVLLITESRVLIFFSDSKKIDYSECLLAENDTNITEWAKAIFEYYWQKADPISKAELLL